MPFTFVKTAIEGLLLIEPHCCFDDRGYLIKDFEKGEFKKHGLSIKLYETFESMSRKGTLRGLHFQTSYSQAKLIRVTQGAAFDVAVDLRLESDTLGHWAGFYLNGHNPNMLYIPEGFAHGFLALEDHTVMTYKCTNRYSKPHDSGIVWNDKELAIKWPLHLVEGELVISERDQKHPSFSAYLKSCNENI